jgi:hypothetical protein
MSCKDYGLKSDFGEAFASRKLKKLIPQIFYDASRAEAAHSAAQAELPGTGH